jgi:signal transduction histidine kinase
LSCSEPSLSWRLISRVVLASSVAVLVAYAWLYWKNFKVAEVLRDRTLIGQAQDIAQHLWLGPDGSVRLQLPAQLEEAYDDKKGTYHYAVRDVSRELLISSRTSVGLAPDLGRRNPRVYDYDRNIDRTQHVFGAAAETRLGHRSLVVQVERSSTSGDTLGAKVVREFFTDGGWLGAPFVLALLAMCAVTVRGTLAPVRRLSALATQIGPARADLRLPETGIPSEVLPLVRAVNSALERLEGGFRQQREFTANAAHQLRTPLAVLTANIDLIPDAAIASSLRRDLQAMSRLATQLLLVARLEASAVDLEQPVDLGALARETVISLGPIAVATGKTIAVDADNAPILVRGNPLLIRCALDNRMRTQSCLLPRAPRC